MVKRKFQSEDGQLFDTEAEAEAHEAVVDNKADWSTKLSSFGLDANGVGVVLENALAIYNLFDDEFGHITQKDRDV